MSADADSIELQVEEAAQLFNTLDPFPFRERDLDREAEEFIVGWARELPHKKPFRIVIHLPESECKPGLAEQLRDALSRYFTYRADMTGRDLNEMFRVGRLSLAIGIAVLAACIVTAGFASRMFGTGELARFVNEGIIILGWVANWRPIEILLYDWWPLVRRRNLYRRLAASEIELKPHA
ncbi:MAG TPA: hypothetical protein VLW75_00850 [Rhizomicrobium sp.]|nr:hypothetical protein [Rhizomicrobium sp.]